MRWNEMPSRYRSGSHLSRTCFWWSYRSESNANGASQDWAKLLSEANPPPEEPLFFCWEGLTFKRIICNAVTTWIFHRLLTFSGQQWLKIFNRATESRHPSSIQGIIHPRGGKWRVRRKTLCIIWVNGYAPEYVIHIHFHHKCSRKTI